MMLTAMKLQYKAWALVFLIVGMCAFSAMLGARYFVGESFAQLERDRAEREGERARRVLDQQVQALAATARDYAYWDDAVDFLQGRNPDFLAENFATENLGYLRVSEVVMFDGRGKTVASVTLDDRGALAAVPGSRVEPLRGLASAVLASPDLKFSLNTFKVTDGVLDVVSVAAIHRPGVTSQAPQGAIVMVRRLDAAEVARLSEVLMMPAKLSFDTPEHAGEGVHVEAVDADRADLHAVLKDHHGRPVAELVLGLDRRLEEQGQVLTWQGMGLAAIAGALASVLLVLLLDRLLLRRLQVLHTGVARVVAEGPVQSQGVEVQGSDEIAQLAMGINGLLDKVKSDALAQQEAHEQKEALQQQLMQSQKTEALGRLTGGIAHDFNNSLAAITGWVRLATEDLDSAHPSHEALQQALKSTRYADGLMRQLLAFGRQSAPRLRRLHWTTLIEETRALVSSGLTRNCEVVVDYRVDDDEVDADPTQLQQVLVNLLINAADAMKGVGRIDLTLQSLDLPGDGPLAPGAAGLAAGHYLMLSVRDHGPGIPPEHVDRVFEPFFTTKAKGRGTGLGLSVAQGIMARHHGAIGLVNGTDGACFLLFLPVSRREASVAPITSPGGPGQGRQLLFVDDDQSVRHAWAALLERKGWQVTRARDGEEAWAQFSQTGQHFDVVLTDQSMPRLDGVGLAQRIRATTAPPPVVLMSGHVDEVDAQLLKTLFAAVLHKPVEPAELDRVLHGLPMSEQQLATQL